MENSTKAFYMVAGALIGIMVLTAFALVFSKGGQALSEIDNKEISRQIEEYNSKLIIYNRLGIDEDEDGIYEDNYNTIFDVVTACNLAYDINNKNMFDDKNYLEVDLMIKTPPVQTYKLENKEEQVKGYIGTTPLTQLINEFGQKVDFNPNIDIYEYDYDYKFSGKAIYDLQTGKIVKIEFEELQESR